MAGRRPTDDDEDMTATSEPRARLVDPSLVDAAEVAHALGVDPEQGLSDDEAARRLARDGPNVLRSQPPEPVWHKILRQFQDPLVYLLLVAIAVATAAWLAEGAEGMPVDPAVIAAILIANAVLGFVQEQRAADAVAALADLTAPTSTVVRDGRLTTIPSADLVVGDVLSLSEGDAVGGDARLVTTAGLRVQEASLTGESAAVEKTAQPLAEPAVAGDRVNMAFGGTAVVQGVGTAVVTATGMDTEMGSIARMLEDTDTEPSPLQREIASVSKALGAAVLAIAVIVMAATAVVNGVRSVDDVVTVLLLGVSLAVAAVPEGLPAILTLVLAIGVKAMARRQAIVKRLHSVETLGSASVICADKTGTLTRNEMTLRTVVTPTGILELGGTGYDPEGTARVSSTRSGADDEAVLEAARQVVVGGALANNAQLDRTDDGWCIEGDPTEAAFLVAAHKLEGALDRVAGYRRAGEIPFTSERKMMSALGAERDGGRRVLMTKGAPDVLLRHCTSILVGDVSTPLGDELLARCLSDVDALSERGFRTIAVAYRTIGRSDTATDGVELDPSLEEDLVYVGVAGIIDPPRGEAVVAIEEARRAGIRVVMITGDHPRTATAVATDLGIVGPGSVALTGAELDTMDDAELTAVVDGVSVFARVAPAHKLRIVDALQGRGHVVAMTGDGVNDAPALKSADIGVAMGITGTEVTKGAAAMILGNDDFATIVAAVRQGRTIFDNITKFLRYLLSSNMGEVATVFFGVVLAGALGLVDAEVRGAVVVPLLATQILWINLVTDSGPALALGVDPEIDDVMARPPRRSTDRILDRRMWTTIFGVGLVMGAVSLLAIDLYLPGGLVDGSGDLTTARTAGFTTLVFAQLFNLLNTRSSTSSAFRHLFVNRWLWGAVALAILLQVLVVEVPLLQVAFGTAALSPGQWLVTAALASTVLWLGEIAKLIRGRLARGAWSTGRRARRAR